MASLICASEISNGSTLAVVSVEEHEALKQELEQLRARQTQMLRGIAPFMKHCQQMVRENAELKEMEYALRSHIATLNDVMHGDDAHLSFVSCDVCECPLAPPRKKVSPHQSSLHAIKCKACEGVEDVCSGCCRYPIAHGWE
jgi:hypothetical protein